MRSSLAAAPIRRGAAPEAGALLLLAGTAAARLSAEVAHRLLGGKAASLAWLLREGFPVPPWFVLPSAFLDVFLARAGLRREALALRSELQAALPGRGEVPPSLASRLAALRAALRHRPLPAELAAVLRHAARPLLARGPVAVRSSGLQEDLETASFAGQYRTFLGVRDDAALRDAVRACLAAAWAPRVLAYAARQGLAPDPLAMAVVVQAQVPARCAGVAFSVDPVTGRDDVVLVEACAGLGDALVDGRVEPQRYRLAWRDAREAAVSLPRPGPRLLAPRELARLADMVVELQYRQGRPVDVEWAWGPGGPWLLQCRPVTRIATDAVPGAWTTADLKDGGVSARATTPLMAGLYEHVFAATLPAYLDRVGLPARVPESLPWMRRAFGRLYWNVGQVKARLAALPGFRERSFDQDLGIEPAYPGDGCCTPMTPAGVVRGLRVLRRVPRLARRAVAANTRQQPVRAALIRPFENDRPEALPETELRRRLRLLLEQVHPILESAYFRTIYHVSNNQTLFRERLRSWLPAGTAAGAELELLGGLQDLSHLRAWRDEERLAATLRRDPAAARLLADIPPGLLARRLMAGEEFPGAASLRAHLARHGHLGPATLDLRVPRWSEDPTPLLASLRRRLHEDLPPPGRQPGDAARAAAARERVVAALNGPLGPWRRRSLRRSLALLRELLWWREELRMLSTRVYAQVRRWSLAWGRCQAAAGFLDAADDVLFLERSELLDWLHCGHPPPGHRARIRRARRAFDGFRNFRNPDELGSRAAASAPAAGPVLQGIAGAAGRSRGPARILRDVAETGRLRPGDVLVTAFTDPGWTHCFPGLAAVVTETGGVLSHAAVIARECGFPAVLGLREATRCIPEGALVEVDGGAGTVRLLDRRPDRSTRGGA